MIQFRPLPAIADSQKGTKPPDTWPQPPATGYAGSEQVAALVGRDWSPWWKKVRPSYATNLVPRAIGFSEIALALNIEHNNGWSFEFCMRFCEENLIDTPRGLAAAPALPKLTTRGRAIADEVLAGAIANALVMQDGYEFLGDLPAYSNKHADMVRRIWPGKGPDYLFAKIGAAPDNYVAKYLFLEAKGVASAMAPTTPPDFAENKAQSLNAEMRFACASRPVLSYTYLPVAAPARGARYGHRRELPKPGGALVVQWFNATEREPEQQDRTSQARLLLQIACDQFFRLLTKSRLQWSEVMGVGADKRGPWRTPTQQGRLLIFVSRDGLTAVSVDKRAPSFFMDSESLLIRIVGLADPDLSIQTDRLLMHVSILRSLGEPPRFPDSETLKVGRRRFKVIARDATGIGFLRRVLA